MRTRKEILTDLILYRKELGTIQEELSIFAWDCNTPIVILTNTEIKEVFENYLNDNISNEELEDWANAIEMREDIGFDPDKIKEIIFNIANPILTESISKEKIELYIANLNN
ncbi:MAG: hypothetical protein MH472_14630 [Bacteroidia bacterium]|nr:hypothetical protein [Bacteroidia bacterium]